MPPPRDTLSRSSKTSCNRSYSPLLCRSRKSVSLSWRDGPLSANSIFTPTPPMQKQYRKVKLPDNKDCGSCALFPVCMGGCPDDNIHSRNIIECDMYREHLVDRKLLEIRIHNRLINESCTSGLRQ